MSEMFARFFRWNNSRLIGTKSWMGEKILKLFFSLSLIVYRRRLPAPPTASGLVTIRNFDSDLNMVVDKTKAMGSAIYWTGFHEFREFLFLHQFLKPEMIFVDVGANLGEYTLFAAKRLREGRVLAFEPLPSMRATLRKNIKLNGFDNVEVIPVGLSSDPQVLIIHEFEDAHEGLATFYPGDRPSRSSQTVQLKKLDDVVPDHNLTRIDFIKMDIEGGELKALQGSRAVIEKYRPVFLIEINELTYRAAGYTTSDVLSFFTAAGYQPYEIRRRGRIQPCEALPAFGNILFMPQ